MRAHRQNLLLSRPQLLDPHVCRLPFRKQEFLKVDQRFQAYTEDRDRGRGLDREGNHFENFEWQELVLHNYAAVELVGVRFGYLVSHDVCGSLADVHQKRSVDEPHSPRLLRRDVELAQDRCLWMETADRIVTVAEASCAQVGQIFIELDFESVRNEPFYKGTLQETLGVLNKEHLALKADVR